MNLSIRKTMLISFVFLTTVIFVLGVLVILLFLNQSTLYESQNKKFESYLLADELRQSSDDLTRLMRTYSMTGEEKYKKYFFDILDIRNGKKPRPQKYNRIYWDFYTVKKEKPRPDSSVSKQLTDLMKEKGFSEQEFQYLEQAKKNSDALVRTEEIAMSATEGKIEQDAKDLIKPGESLSEFSKRILHDEKYHSDKFNIMKPIDEFYIFLENRTNKEVLDNKSKQNLLLNITLGAITFLVIILIYCFYLIHKMVTIPILHFTGDIKEISKRKDLTKILETDVDNEIRSLATEFNSFTNNIKGIFLSFLKNSNKVNVLSISLEKAIQNAKESMSEVSHATNSVADETTRMMTYTESINLMMNESKLKIIHSANLSKNNSNNSKTLFIEITSATSELTKANQELKIITKQLEETAKATEILSEKSREIQLVLNSVKDISKQTSLLALNAAIESARAGEHGKGFSVVADEVGNLSIQTVKATEQISRVIQDITLEISNSVSQIKLTNNSSKSLSKIIDKIGSVISSNVQLVKVNEEESTMVSNELNEIQNNIIHVNELTAKIVKVNQELAASGEEVSASMKMKLDSLEEIKSQVEELNSESSKIKLDLDSFKIGV